MPITVKKVEKVEAPKVIESAKITSIRIDVKNKQIELSLDYGKIVNGTMNVVDRQHFRLEDAEFTSIAAVVTKGNMTIYDELAAVIYDWLVAHNKLKYSV